MFKRRLLLRLAVAVVTFMIGLAAASLFGAGRPARYFAPSPQVRFYYVPYGTARGEFESPMPPCGSFRMQHAFERHPWRERDFDFDAPPPPPRAPAKPGYPEP